MREGRAIRKPLSCAPCRTRKLRCDRGVPACSHCVHRGDIIECSYARSERQTTARLSRPTAELRPSAQDKLDHLERLVVGLLDEKRANEQVVTPSTTNGSSSNPPQHSTVDTDLGSVHTNDEAHHRIDRNRASATSLCADGNGEVRWSVDEARWESLLNGISDVRAHLQAQRQQYDEQRNSESDCGPALLFGSSPSIPITEILSHLPSKYSCDIMVERYFAHLYPPLHILHPPTFRKQYTNFWQDQRATSVVWVGLLFAILRIAMLDYLREGDEPIEWHGKCRDMASSYRNLFTESMIAANYLEPHEFIVEALCLHYYGEYVSSRDAKSSVWILLGMVTRFAMRMGYHQTAQPTLHCSPFKNEMRRRVWAFIRQGDIMISFQLGLPAMVDLSVNDSNLPRNIYDEDISEDCTSLPPAQPSSIPTEISFLLAKTRLAFGFSRAAAEINLPSGSTWERLLEIDRELRQIYDNIPDVYKLGLLSADDSLILTSAKMTLACISYKSLCVLHSRFLDPAGSDPRYMYSIKDIPVDGQVRSLTNYQTSLTIHDFLIATAIISSHLSSLPRRSSPGMPSRAEMIKALRISADIFRRMRTQSKEANTAADVLSMLVAKFDDGQGAPSTDRRETNLRSREKQAVGKATERSTLGQRQSRIAATTPIVSSLDTASSSYHSTTRYIATADIPRQHDPSWSNLRDRGGTLGRPQSDLLSTGDSFDFGLDEQDRDAATNQQVSECLWPTGMSQMDVGMRYEHHIQHRADLDDSQPSQLMDSYQWFPSVAMNDPLSTLFDLNSEFSNDVF